MCFKLAHNCRGSGHDHAFTTACLQASPQPECRVVGKWQGAAASPTFARRWCSRLFRPHSPAPPSQSLPSRRGAGPSSWRAGQVVQLQRPASPGNKGGAGFAQINLPRHLILHFPPVFNSCYEFQVCYGVPSSLSALVKCAPCCTWYRRGGC